VTSLFRLFHSCNSWLACHPETASGEAGDSETATADWRRRASTTEGGPARACRLRGQRGSAHDSRVHDRRPERARGGGDGQTARPRDGDSASGSWRLEEWRRRRGCLYWAYSLVDRDCGGSPGSPGRRSALHRTDWSTCSSFK
jgi:hypothetical protein